MQVARHQQAKDLKAAGKSTAEIAKVMGLRRCAVQSYLSYVPAEKRGGKPTRGPNVKADRVLKARALRDQGMSLAGIGLELDGISRQRVEQLLQKDCDTNNTPFPHPVTITVWECSDGRVIGKETDALRYELELARQPVPQP